MVYTHVYVHTGTHTPSYTSTHIYIHLCTYTCIYTCTYTHLKSQRKAVEVMIRSEQEERGREEEVPDRYHTSPEQSALASWMHWCLSETGTKKTSTPAIIAHTGHLAHYKSCRSYNAQPFKEAKHLSKRWRRQRAVIVDLNGFTATTDPGVPCTTGLRLCTLELLGTR